MSYLSELFYFFAFWFQPVFWMWLFNYKAPPWLNSLRFILPAGSAIAGATMILPQFSAFYVAYPYFYTMAFYSALGVAFAYLLAAWHGWSLTHAISIGALTAFVGSYLWEVPYIIKNTFTTSISDWALHLFGFLLVWSIQYYVGWVSLIRALPFLLLSLTVSVACMVIYPISSPAPGEWNVPIYMFNRGFACVITYILLKKEGK